MPVMVPVRLPKFVTRTDAMVGFDVTGSDAVIGPNSPAPKAIVKM